MKLKKPTFDFSKADKKKIPIACILTVLLLLAVCFASFSKDIKQEHIASQSDSVITLNAGQPVLTQSWQANSKNVTGIQLITDNAQNQNLQGKLHLGIKKNIEEDYMVETEAELSAIAEDGSLLLNIPETKLDLGQRYYFELSIVDYAEDTQLAIAIDSNYGGLTVAKEDVPGALSAAVLYQSAGNLAWLLKIILLFTGITCLIMIGFRRDFAESLALSFGVVFVYVYLWGVFGQLEFGVNSLYVIGMLIAISVPFLAWYKGRKWQEIISPGMLAFWGLFLVYFILDRNVLTGKVDDLNHWQLCVRDMWYFDSYPFHKGSTLIAMRYTPGFATIEYLFLYLYGAFREGIILLGCHMTGFAMMSVLLSKIPWRQFHKVIPLTVLIAGLPLLVYESHYGILYVDAYLGMIGAYILICYFTEEYSLFNVLRVTFASILLIMTKEMGLAIAGTIYLIIFIDLILKNRKWKELIKAKATKAYFFSGCLALFSFVSWQIYIRVAEKMMGESNSFNHISDLFAASGEKVGPAVERTILLASSADTNAVRNAIAQTVNVNLEVSNATPLETIYEMIHWILREKLFICGSYAELTLVTILLCAALGIAGLYRKYKIPMTQLIVSLLIGTGFYTAFLVLCYIFLFDEASAIPAARRYMGSYLLVYMITIIGVLIVKANQTEEKGNWKQPFIWIVAVFVIMAVPDNHRYYSTEENFGQYFTTWKNRQVVGEVFRSFADQEEKVYYVEYTDSELVPQYNYLVFANAVVPNLTQGFGKGWKPVVDMNAEYNNYKVQYSVDEWEQLLAEQYSYVYVSFADDYFVENYGSLFSDVSQIENGAIFKVVHLDEQNVTLQKIAKKDLN